MNFRFKSLKSGSGQGSRSIITSLSPISKLIAHCSAQVVKKQFALNLTSSNLTKGSVSNFPDVTLYDYDTQVQITATPESNAFFNGWSEDTSGTTNPLVVTVDTVKNIIGNFLHKAPTSVSYPFTDTTFFHGVSISPIVPTVTGNSASSFSISPSIGSGLSFNTSNGWIFGTTSQSNGTTYTITASNEGGTTSTQVTMRAYTFIITSPLVGSSYNRGQTMNVKWLDSPNVDWQAMVWLSVDAGMTWHVYCTYSITTDSDEWADWNLPVQSEVNGIPSTVSDSCMIKVTGFYDRRLHGQTLGFFSIK